RADVYALGCLLFEMVTGRICFEAPTIMGMLSKHLVDEADAPSTRRPDLQIPPAFDQLVLAALAKEPPARPATMEVYGEQITTMLQALPPDQRRAITSGVMAAPAATGGATGGPATGFAPPTPPPMGLAPTGFGGVGPTAIVGPPSAMVPIAASPVGTPLPASALGSGVQPLGAPTTMPPGMPPSMPGTTTTAAKSRSMLYVIIGVVVLLIVVGIVMTRGDKAGKQARAPSDRIDHGHRADPADDDDVVDPPGGDDDDVDEAKLRKQMEDLERLGDELRKHPPVDDN
ncbi:MAG: hypothetical protein NT062_05095, partial [Proteobacteria bacterium]|nr:hypothetical protein [Pseudomonadota bacterium]